MQKIKVKVSVEFASGATVELTRAQNDKVTEYVEGILFGRGQTPQVVQTFKKKNYRMWTSKEVDLIKMALEVPQGRERNKVIRRIANATNRTRGHVSSKIYSVNAEQKKAVSVFGGHSQVVPVTNPSLKSWLG